MNKIINIAHIRYGVSLRKSVNPDANGNAHLIQMSSLREDGTINHNAVVRIRHSIKKWQTVMHGDILLCARGGNNKAAIMDKESDCHIAALHLIVIRPKPSLVAPEYLLWHLNHPHSQATLAAHATGTNLKMVGLSQLAELPVPLPSLSQQRIIGAYAQLAQQRRALEARLTEKRHTQTQASLWQAARETEERQSA